MINQSAEELFPLVDPEGRVVGSATRSQCHSGSMLLHPVVHLHVVNSAGELYLQRRPAWKDIQPNRWDSGVGGHVDFGESTDEALVRESREELGIEGFEPRFVCSYTFISECEAELVNVFVTHFDGAINPTEELDGGRFWSGAQIMDALGREIFTPNFERELREVLLPRGIVKLPVPASLYFRAARRTDLPQLLAIVAESQSLLRERGVDQWQDGYPSSEVLEDDIRLERGYILASEGIVVAYGAIIGGEEPAYTALENGAWLSTEEYLTLHRLAVSAAFRGQNIGEQFIAEVEREALRRGLKSLRADTHRDNGVMLRLLSRMGFTPCGDVYFRGSHRFAFERTL